VEHKPDNILDEIFAYLARIEAKVDAMLDIIEDIEEEDYDDAEINPFGRERDNNETL
jgi:hypothetical protein